MKMKINWKARGKRQDTDPLKNENPNVTQLDNMKPKMLRIISMRLAMVMLL